MKNLIFFVSMLTFLQNLNGMEIEDQTKFDPAALAVLDDPKILAALQATLGITRKYPKKIGNKEIPLSSALTFSPEARKLTDEITDPSCLNRMYGRGSKVLTQDQIDRLEKHIPANILAGMKVRKETSWNPILCKNTGGAEVYRGNDWHPFCDAMDDTWIARNIKWNQPCQQCVSGVCALTSVGCFFSGMVLILTGCYAKNSGEARAMSNAPAMIEVGTWFAEPPCIFCAIVAGLGIIYPCVCRKTQPYSFGNEVRGQTREMETSDSDTESD
jgi:hypothetical protein